MKAPIRIATSSQLERSARAAGYETVCVPPEIDRDFHRSMEERTHDGPLMVQFLEKNNIDLVIDFNTRTLTLLADEKDDQQARLTHAQCGVKYAALYLDPITSTMGNANWFDHWRLLEDPGWFKGIFEYGHAGELHQLGIPGLIRVPMAAGVDDFNTDELPDPDPGPVIAFMGHPASGWFGSPNAVLPAQLFAGLTASAVHADLPDVPFHKIYYDMYEFAEPPTPMDSPKERATKAFDYFQQKFVYNAFLAIKQRDRYAHFLKKKLGDHFELIGDFWHQHYGLAHTPRIWNMNELHERMRRVPICLNLIKGNIETGLIIRHFEVTAYGGFLLTLATPELSEFFEIGEECDVFHNEEELLQKIRFYLENPRRRVEIARAGQARTLREHLYSHRIEDVVKALFQSPVTEQNASRTLELAE
ncbi:MAG: glycosyltransferase family protein [Phycisphaerae bacterium]